MSKYDARHIHVNVEPKGPFCRMMKRREDVKWIKNRKVREYMNVKPVMNMALRVEH